MLQAGYVVFYLTVDTFSGVLVELSACYCHYYLQVHPDTHDQYILFGADEGIYTLNLHELHENTMEQLFPRKCTWLYVINDVLMSISGRLSIQTKIEMLGIELNC